MDRRSLLKLLAAAALAGCGTRDTSAIPLRVVVAGAGIIGASIGYHLAKAGAAVTIIDKQGPASHASRDTFAWINATWAKQPQSYHAFSRESVANWHDLQQALDLPVRWGGSLEWFDDAARQQTLVAQIAEQAAWGEPARMLDAAEFVALEPRLLIPAEMSGVEIAGRRLTSVVTAAGSVPADRLVIATGAAPHVARDIAAIDIPQRTRPGVIVVSEPVARRLQHIISATGIHMHQREDGRIVLGEQDGAPQNEAHAMRLAGRPNSFPDPAIAAHELLAGATLPQPRAYRPERAFADMRRY